MTVVAALHQDGGTWIGADSQRTWAGTRLLGTNKIIEAPGIALGCSGNSKAQALVRQNLSSILTDRDEWQIVQRVRALMDDDKWAHMSSDDGKGPQDYGFTMILATPAQVFLISGNFDLHPFDEGELLAVGSGAEYALGAGEVLRGSTAEARVRGAVSAAVKWDTGCGGDVRVARVAPVMLQAAQ